jgi:hypothetical protein
MELTQQPAVQPAPIITSQGNSKTPVAILSLLLLGSLASTAYFYLKAQQYEAVATQQQAQKFVPLMDQTVSTSSESGVVQGFVFSHKEVVPSEMYGDSTNCYYVGEVTLHGIYKYIEMNGYGVEINEADRRLFPNVEGCMEIENSVFSNPEAMELYLKEKGVDRPKEWNYSWNLPVTIIVRDFHAHTGGKGAINFTELVSVIQ